MTRYTDMDISASGAQDFVIRKRKPTFPQLIIIFLSTLLLIVSVTVTIADKYILVAILFVLLAVVGWYVILQTQRNRDLLLATEFQNALFASALGMNNKFCLIMKRDGNIVYLDRSFQQMFPDFLKQARRTIDILLEHGKVSNEDSGKIYSAIERGVYDKVIFDIRATGGVYHRVVMSIEPILRPSGFILLRGREYVETRSANEEQAGSARASSVINKHSVTLFSNVMDGMNMGIYMTGPDGNIVYANPVLEQWLGYREGEINSLNLSLQDIISQGGSRAGRIEPDNFEGEVTLIKKAGGTIKSIMNQKLIRDENGKSIGCTALLNNMVEQDAELKKKLW